MNWRCILADRARYLTAAQSLVGQGFAAHAISGRRGPGGAVSGTYALTQPNGHG